MGLDCTKFDGLNEFQPYSITCIWNNPSIGNHLNHKDLEFIQLQSFMTEIRINYQEYISHYLHHLAIWYFINRILQKYKQNHTRGFRLMFVV